MPDSDDRPGREQWCAGLRHSGPRALADRLRVRVTARARELRRQTLVIGLGAAALLGVTSGLAPWEAYGPGGLAAAWAIEIGLVGVVLCLVRGRGVWRALAVLGSVYLLAWAVLGVVSPSLIEGIASFTSSIGIGMIFLGVSRVTVRGFAGARLLLRARRLAADCSAGRVERFEGLLGNNFEDQTLRALLSLGYLQREDRAQQIELLPRSGLVVSANGRPVEDWIIARISEVAPAQLHALRVALPAGIRWTESEPSLSLCRRSLSPAERTEIRTHIRTLRRNLWIPAIVTIMVAGVVAFHLHEYGWRSLADLGVLPWYGLALLANGAYVRRVFAARKLELDWGLRWVVTVHDRGVDSTSPPRLEILPVSQLAWTEDAKPAAWRISEP